MDAGPGTEVGQVDLEALVVRGSVCGDGPFLPLAAWWVHNELVPSAEDPVRSCQSVAADCTAFFACEGTDDSQSCVSSELEGHCEGDVLVSCETRYVRRRDCGEDGDGNVRCLLDSFGNARCAAGACGELGDFCDGDVPVLCQSGLLIRKQDCDLDGRQCFVDRGAYDCVDRVESCDRDVCDGDTLRTCQGGVGTRDIDCASVDAHCDDTSTGLDCVPDAPECEEGDVACDGTRARACQLGHWWEIDCSRFADATCELEWVGEAYYFRCRAPSGG